MPIYEYICNACGAKFSLLLSMSAANKAVSCSSCSSEDTRKIISSFCCSGSDGDYSSSGHSHGGGGG